MQTNKICKLSTKDNQVWFTSDTHFSHYNIIKYCDRPYKNIQDMNDNIIKSWNSVVGKNDIVFHLGDFGFASISTLQSIRNQLNGKIYLIRGNHDWKTINRCNEHIFDGVYQQLTIQVDGQRIYLNHYPYLCFSGSNRWGKNSVWELFGHVHSKPNMKGTDKSRLVMLYPTQYDVGVDNNDYRPISFNEVKEKINKQITFCKSWKYNIISKIIRLIFKMLV